MADTLTACSFALAMKVATQSNDADRTNKVTDSVEIGSAKFPAISRALTNGTTGANHARYFWQKRLSIVTGVPQTFVLGDGTLKNGRGQNVAFSRLRRLLARVRNPDGIDLSVTLALTGTAAFFIDHGSGDSLVFITDIYYQSHDTVGWPVGATDTMVITAGGSGTVDLDVLLVGS